MQAGETGSWVVRLDVPMEPHVALFVRDSLGLGESTGTGKLPPRLEGEIPDWSSLVTDDEHERLQQSFASWWPSSFAGATLAEAGQTTDPAARHRQLEQFHSDFYAPLASYPELRHAASTWFYGHQKSHVRHDPDASRRYWTVCRDAAEAAAEELGVAPGELHATTLLLLVQDVWYATPEPGRLLYSPTVGDDAELLFELLFDTFRSGAGLGHRH